MKDFDLSALVAAAARLQAIWESLDMEFCFIGGLAVQHWGEPRQTSDVDATVWTEFGNERPVIDRLLCDLAPRIDDADDFALVNRVLLGEESGGVSVDVSLAAFPFERNLIERSELRSYRDTQLRICGASDLVILKAFANRDRDWTDIRGILIRSRADLDWALIEEEVQVLSDLKQEPEIVDRLKTLRAETGSR